MLYDISSPLIINGYQNKAGGDDVDIDKVVFGQGTEWYFVMKL